MTGGVVSGYLLGCFWAVGFVFGALNLLGWPRPTTVPAASSIADLGEYVVLAVLYFSSAARLRRQLIEHPDVPLDALTTAPPIKGLD